jgi:translation initiation factor 2B subunit (eIF-2B alpha/beta/delta family)
MIDPQTAVTALGSAGVGVVSGAWLTQHLIKRLIRQNDEKHEKHEARFERLIERFGDALQDLKTKLAVMEVIVGEAKHIRSDLKEVSDQLALTEQRAQKAHDRLDDANARIAELDEDIRDMASSDTIGG